MKGHALENAQSLSSRGDAQGAVVPKPLDALRFPLTGRSLIEASAGTGKTFTIAMLYVRLVLGHAGLHGDRARSPAPIVPLTPPEILVVTFTDAATKELRDRIRARLSEAAAYFQIAPDEVEPLPRHQDLLHDLRADYPEDRWLACARKLQLAAEWMDEAAVSTIHGWCNRMLREHAFDSDSLFSQSLETDQTELLADVVRDYWRSFMSTLGQRDADQIAEWFDDPDALRAKARGLLDYADALPDGASPREALSAAKETKATALAEIKAPWASWLDEMEGLLDAARAAGQFAPRKLMPHHCREWFNQLRSWARDDAQSLPESKALWANLTPAGLAAVCINGEPPSHAGFAALETLRATVAALPDGKNDVLCHAVKWIAHRFGDEQSRRSQMGFNELLTKLDSALRGPNAERLASVIRTQFPVALIDEFQDTDPVQYRIFDTIYGDARQASRGESVSNAGSDAEPGGLFDEPTRIHETPQSTALIMIGDPKQAIYAFRGADIYTYLAARYACGDQLYTLARNFRSTREMVDAVNTCFSIAERREYGAGAFMFRDAHGNPVPFAEVDAKGRSARFVIDGEPGTALTAWWLDADNEKGTLSKTAFLDRMSAACASEMVRLLNQGQRAQTGFAGPHGFQPLRPADIAVLVNNRGEADAIRSALARRGVRTVYLSDKDSVFTTSPAAEIQHWLAACAEPDDGRLVRTALATRTLGLSWHELDALFANELAWEARVMQFREYRECWRRQGVLPMLRRVLNEYRVPARLLDMPDGERTLTDILHLSELLQQASLLIEGEHGLIRWLAEERQAAEGDAASTGDAQQMRLESDGDLVKVVTVHKSKGLEYPLVFLPFACTYREVDIHDVPLKWHDDQGALHVELAGSALSVERADRERLGEDLRKLYVALTRAQYATWVGLAPLDGIERSAFGYLLSGGEPFGDRTLGTVLASQFDACPDIDVGEAPPPSDERFEGIEAVAQIGTARRSIKVVGEPWWIASYSSLKMAQGDDASAADTPAEDVMIELLDAEPLDDAEHGEGALAGIGSPDIAGDIARGSRGDGVSIKLGTDAGALTLGTTSASGSGSASASASASALAPIHDFPRGSDPGTFLHDLLEWAATEGFAQVAGDPASLRDVVARRCNVRGWQRWIDVLTDWLLRLISTPLVLPETNGVEAATITLSGLDTYLAEMEFWVAAHAVDTTLIDDAVRHGTLDGAPRPRLEAARLNGMLKGFMDLVFEHDGRYYVADYKSNWLGPDDAAYSTERMREQILHSRYELQYVLYLFALHRLLKARLPDYDYDLHIGGAVYLFVRGIGAPTQGIHVERPPRELIDELDALFSNDTDAPMRDEAFA